MKFWKTESFFFSPFHLFLSLFLFKRKLKYKILIPLNFENIHSCWNAYPLLKKKSIVKGTIYAKRLRSFKANSSTLLSYDARYYDK